MFVDAYGWLNGMTIHKIFIHRTVILSPALFPIGQLTEKTHEPTKYTHSKILATEQTVNRTFENVMQESRN